MNGLFREDANLVILKKQLTFFSFISFYDFCVTISTAFTMTKFHITNIYLRCFNFLTLPESLKHSNDYWEMHKIICLYVCIKVIFISANDMLKRIEIDVRTKKSPSFDC